MSLCFAFFFLYFRTNQKTGSLGNIEKSGNYRNFRKNSGFNKKSVIVWVMENEVLGQTGVYVVIKLPFSIDNSKT